jgi:hypothetical protein
MVNGGVHPLNVSLSVSPETVAERIAGPEADLVDDSADDSDPCPEEVHVSVVSVGDGCAAVGVEAPQGDDGDPCPEALHMRVVAAGDGCTAVGVEAPQADRSVKAKPATSARE